MQVSSQFICIVHRWCYVGESLPSSHCPWPYEKLVIETRASGGYQQFDWEKNGNPFTTAPGQPFTVSTQEFPNFFEIFVREPTTANDLGVYEVEVIVNTGPQVPEVQFAVTPYSKYMFKVFSFMCFCWAHLPIRRIFFYANLYIIMYYSHGR